MQRQAMPRGSLWAMIIVVLAAISAWGFVAAYKEISLQRRIENHQRAAQNMSLIKSALESFRSDYPSDVVDAWDGTVAGLRDHIPKGEKMPVNLLPEEIAAADPSQANAKPLHGYWYILLDDKRESPMVQSKAKKTICAYPAEYGRAGRYTFLLTTEHSLMADTAGIPPKVTPAEHDLVNKWARCN